jgi:hypothetical protein
MHFFSFAEKDATLYEGSATQSRNTGLDEILEIRKDMNADGSVVNVSRVLVKFNLANISSSIVAGTIPENARYYLNLYDASSTELTTSQSLYAHPVSQSWVQGDGRFFDKPATTEGTSWRYRDGENTGTQWVSGSNNTGGTWFAGSGYEASQSFNHETTDMRMDVTDIVKKWISGSIPNEGFMLKRSGSVGNTSSSLDEGSTDRLGHYAFFSRDTHTIYPPKLEVVYDDSSFSTGSLSTLDADDVDDVVVYMKGLRDEYKEKSKVKFRVYGRERFPARTYSTSSQNLTVKFIPSKSQYSVRDALTEDTIVPFSTGSYLSCDGTSNFFRLDLNAFQPERHYRFLYKVVSGSGNTRVEHILDEDHIFKVTR